MDNFGFAIFYINHPYQDTELEQYYDSIERKLETFNFNASLTTKMYRDGLKETQKELTKQYDIDIKKAGELYDEIIAQEGNHEEAHLIAEHTAQFEYIAEKYHEDQSKITSVYKEMALEYYTALLITLYSLLETETKRFCKILQQTFSKRIAHKDLDQKDYFMASINYLDLVIELDIKKLKDFNNKITHLQYIRNRFVHEGGEFSKLEDKLENAIKDSKGLLEIIPTPKGHQLFIKKVDYITSYIELLRDFYQTTLFETELRYNYPIMAKRIAHIFSIANTSLEASDISIKTIKKGYVIYCKLHSDSTSQIIDFKCNISITKAKENKLEIISQLENDLLNNMIDLMPIQNNIIFDIFLKGFNLKKEKFHVSIKVY